MKRFKQLQKQKKITKIVFEDQIPQNEEDTNGTISKKKYNRMKKTQSHIMEENLIWRQVTNNFVPSNKYSLGHFQETFSTKLI